MFQFPPSPIIGQQFAPIAGVTYEWNGTGWIFLGPTPASLYPPGVLVAYAGVVTGSPIVPPFQGWLYCDGSSVATATYPALFAVIGYTYGGSGANFNLPDLRGRAVICTQATTLSGRPSARALGAAGGEESHVITVAEMPSHDHGGASAGQSVNHTHGGTTDGQNVNHTHSGTTGTESTTHTHTQQGSTSTGDMTAGGAIGNMAFAETGGQSVNHTHSFTTGGFSADHTHSFNTGGAAVDHQHGLNSEGGGGAHNTMQPFIALNWLIKT